MIAVWAWLIFSLWASLIIAQENNRMLSFLITTYINASNQSG